MDDLVAFLTARLDEDEQLAMAASQGPWRVNSTSYPESIYSDEDDEVVSGGRWGGEASIFDKEQDAFYIAHQHPARVLADVAAKRRILDEVVPEINAMDDRIEGEWGGGGDAPHDENWLLLKLLALPYADHPDYREEWKP